MSVNQRVSTENRNNNSNEVENIFANSSTRNSRIRNNLQTLNSTLSSAAITPTAWIFGYGSLCWFPGFEYSQCVTGYIRGYVRRFWQGNTTHRGTEDKPGRVATLIAEEEGITWGCAYKITGQLALDYLHKRECSLGGYATITTKFYPRMGTGQLDRSGEAFPTLVYIATEGSKYWIGEEDVSVIAKEITECYGPSGHNVEYLIRLTMFMREELPEVHDDHLFTLEKLVTELLMHKNISIATLLGPQPQRVNRDLPDDVRRPTSFEFTSRVPEKKLRCLNI